MVRPKQEENTSKDGFNNTCAFHRIQRPSQSSQQPNDEAGPNVR